MIPARLSWRPAVVAGCSVADVVRALPQDEAVCVEGAHFVQVMQAISEWGKITLIYNLHGKPIGGHLRADACGMIAFVSRKLFGADTQSVQFYAKAGHCLFKVYLGRDAERHLVPEQVRRFAELRDRLANA